MIVTEVHVTVDMRINVGDFEGISIPITLKGVMEEGDNYQECLNALHSEARKTWALKVLSYIKLAREIRKDAKDRGIYKLTGETFDKAIAATVRELKKLASG